MLLQAISVARQSRAHGNHPFGAILADPEDRLLLTAENTVVTAADATGHAETNLVRLAGPTYSLAQLRTFTLYTATEPCAMCSAAIYWVGIGTVVFALAETDLREMTGADVRNPTLALPCRDVFTAGSRPVNVHGPFELAEARDVHGEDSGTRRIRQRQNSLYGRVSHVTSTARYTRRTAVSSAPLSAGGHGL